MFIKLLGIYSLIVMMALVISFIRDGLNKDRIGALIILSPFILFILLTLT